MGYPYHYSERTTLLRRLAIIVGVAVVIAAAYAGLRALDRPEETQEFRLEPAPASIAAPLPTTSPTATTTPDSIVAQAGPTSSSTTAAPSTSSTTSSTTTSSTTTSSTTTTTTVAGLAAAAPVVAIFDTETITLAGAVPSQAAADRLIALTQANSKTPAATINLLTIDPSVAPDVGVRVVELDSVRFPEGEAVVTPEHGLELQRMAAFMNALPQVTVTVIGHADQTGNDIDNLLLSQRRADAVVQFLVDQGISRQRLAAAGAGETDLVTLDDDAAARALNRRTEFIVYNALS